MNKTVFGKRIQTARKKNNISAADLAASAGISLPHLRAIEGGKRLPGLDVFVRLINVLGVSADELLRGYSKVALPLVLNDLTHIMRDMSQEQLMLIETICTALKKQ